MQKKGVVSYIRARFLGFLSLYTCFTLSNHLTTSCSFLQLWDLLITSHGCSSLIFLSQTLVLLLLWTAHTCSLEFWQPKQEPCLGSDFLTAPCLTWGKGMSIWVGGVRVRGPLSSLWSCRPFATATHLSHCAATHHHHCPSSCCCHPLFSSSCHCFSLSCCHLLLLSCYPCYLTALGWCCPCQLSSAVGCPHCWLFISPHHPHPPHKQLLMAVMWGGMSFLWLLSSRMGLVITLWAGACSGGPGGMGAILMLQHS